MSAIERQESREKKRTQSDLSSRCKTRIGAVKLPSRNQVRMIANLTRILREVKANNDIATDFDNLTTEQRAIVQTLINDGHFGSAMLKAVQHVMLHKAHVDNQDVVALARNATVYSDHPPPSYKS